MKLLLISAICVAGLSAQSYVVQNHFSDLINKCSTQMNAIQNNLVNLIRDRYSATANEFPKFVATLSQSRNLIGSTGSSLFTAIDAAVSNNFNRISSDFTDYWFRQDFKSISDTMTEGFYNVRQLTINEYKKGIERVQKRTDCYLNERQVIREVMENFCFDSITAAQDVYKEWEDDIAHIQGDLSTFRSTLGSELKACRQRDCALDYVREN